ncbi:MAG: hypothetical protein P8M34_07695, partial [Saprospiraceae bacterium]|nr:hypothetical protein [Saprospiraceae bacterium]
LKNYNIMRTAIYFLLTSILLSSCISQKKFEELKDERVTCAEELDSISNELASTQEQVESLSAQNIAYSSQIDEQESTIGKLEEDVMTMGYLATQNESYEAIIAQNQSIIVDKDQDIETMTENFRMIVDAVSPGMAVDITSSDMALSDGQVVENVVEAARNNRIPTIRYRTDTVDSAPRYRINEGNIAIYCPNKMTFQKSYDVMSIIADLISDEEIKNTLLTQLSRHEPNVSETDLDQSTLIQKIQYYDLIKLELESAVKDAFEIKPIHDFLEQRIQSGMEGWHWKVTPISEEPNQTLVVKATFITPNGTKKQPFTKSYPVNVDVQPSRFFHTAKMLIINDPGWAIATLIIPFLTFLWGYFIKNKKVKKIISGEES